jgi:membrane-associated phospholipid phosphatase
MACVGMSAARAGDTIETSGQILRVALPAGVAALTLLREDNDGLKQLALSEAAAFGTSYVLQQLVREERPDGEGMDSFPSDSTAVAFSAAAYLERRYGWDHGLPAYALASFVGFSRVQADRHHWHDVAAGALLGWGASMLTTTRYSDNLQLSVGAGYRNATLGAQLRAVW